MDDILRSLILNCTEKEIDDILNIVLERYREVHSDWEISLISIEKKLNHNPQIDSIIAFLNKIKELQDVNLYCLENEF